jgi:NADH-quinone oxidoreductase subunit H
MRYLFFFMAEWGNMFISAAIVVALFLGGWQFPTVSRSAVTMNFLQFVTFNVKVLFLVFVSMWIRGTLPRVRIDQMMSLCWKYFVPISFIDLIGAAIWVGIWPEGNPIAAWIMLAIAIVVAAIFVRRVAHFARQARMELYFRPTI